MLNGGTVALTAYQFLYVGALEREAMLSDRPKVEQAVQAVFSREGFITKRVPDEHAGGKWRLSYQIVAQCYVKMFAMIHRIAIK